MVARMTRPTGLAEALRACCGIQDIADAFTRTEVPMTEIEIDPRKLAAVVYDDRVAIDALLTALRRGLIQSWFTFTGGVGTLLDTRLWVLKEWWREIAPRHPHAR